MPLPKRVKVGGSYFKGYKLVVSAGVGDYVLDMTLAQASCINAIDVITDAYGAGDYFKLQHLDASNVVVETLADTIYNIGAGGTWEFDFSAAELMGAGHKFRLTYTNVAGTALSVYTCVDVIK
jgi:hypothetical protein